MTENEGTVKNEPPKIGVYCAICGECYELDGAAAEYAHHFGTVASLPICKECKEAIKWAKEKMKKDDPKIYLDGEQISTLLPKGVQR